MTSYNVQGKEKVFPHLPKKMSQDVSLQLTVYARSPTGKIWQNMFLTDLTLLRDSSVKELHKFLGMERVK